MASPIHYHQAGVKRRLEEIADASPSKRHCSVNADPVEITCQGLHDLYYALYGCTADEESLPKRGEAFSSGTLDLILADLVTARAGTRVRFAQHREQLLRHMSALSDVHECRYYDMWLTIPKCKGADQDNFEDFHWVLVRIEPGIGEDALLLYENDESHCIFKGTIGSDGKVDVSRNRFKSELISKPARDAIFQLLFGQFGSVASSSPLDEVAEVHDMDVDTVEVPVLSLQELIDKLPSLRGIQLGGPDLNADLHLRGLKKQIEAKQRPGRTCWPEILEQMRNVSGASKGRKYQLWVKVPNIENAVEDEHFAWLLVTAESKQEYDSSCIAASAILGGEEDEFWRVSVGEYGQDEPLLELRFDASYRLCELKYLRKGIHISGTGAEAFKSLLTGAMPSILVDDAEVDLAGSKIYLNVMGLLSTRRISWYGSLGWKPLPCRAISRTDGRPAITHDPSVYTGVLEYFHGLSWDGLLNQMFGDKRVKIQELKNLAEKYPLNSEDSAVVRFSDVWTALCDANRKGTKGAADDLLKVYAALIEPSEDWLNRKQWHRVHHLYCSILNSGALLLGKNFDESSYADVPGDRTSLADVVAQVRTERLELKTWDAAVGVMRLDGLPSLIEAKKAKH